MGDSSNPHGKYGWGQGPKPRPKGVLAKLIAAIEKAQKGKGK